MKLKQKLYRFFSPISLLLISLSTGCGTNDSSKIDSSTAQLYLQTDPFSLDPRVGGDRRSQIIIRELFEGLVRIGKDGLPQLALAKEYRVSDDGRTYTFSLHPSRWSNNDPVTAHDFVYAWKSLIDPDFISPFSYAFYVIKNAKKAHMRECRLDEVGIRAIDDLTLEVSLEHPAPYFIEFASNPLYSPIHRKSAESNQNWSQGPKTYVSNGPFVLEERSLKSHVTLKKNPLYWNSADAPKIEQLSFSIIEDSQTAFNMFLAGTLDWFGEPFGAIPQEMARELDARNELKKYSKGGLYWYVVSTAKPHLKSKKIRQALAHAIDRKSITDNLLQTGETPAFSLVTQEMSQLPKPLFCDNDADSARRLFQEGLEELGLTTDSFPPIVLSHWSDTRDRMLAETVQQQLQQTLGIRIILQSNDWSTYFKKVTSGDLEMGGFGWYSWFFDPMYNLEYIKFRGSGMNGSQWENPDYIAALNEADAAQNSEERNAAIAKAEILAMSEVPIIPVFHQTYKYAISPNIRGQVLSRIGLMELQWLEKGAPEK